MNHEYPLVGVSHMCVITVDTDSDSNVRNSIAELQTRLYEYTDLTSRRSNLVCYDDEANPEDFDIVVSEKKGKAINYTGIINYLGWKGYVIQIGKGVIDCYKYNFETGCYDSIEKENIYFDISQAVQSIEEHPELPASFVTKMNNIVLPNLPKVEEIVKTDEFRKMEKFYTDGEVIPFQNGWYSLRYNALLPKTSCIFNQSIIHADFNPKALENTIGEKYREMMTDDCTYEYLFEQLGYAAYATKKTKVPTITLLYGTGANGKSIVINALERIVGKENISTVGLEEMTNPHTTAQCEGKKLNLVMDAGAGYNNTTFTQISAVSKFLKMATSYETQIVNPKYKPAHSAVLCAKFVFASNNYLNLGDTSGGMSRRFKAVPFTKRFKEDNDLATRFEGKDETDWFAMRCLLGLMAIHHNAMNGEEFVADTPLRGEYIECQPSKDCITTMLAGMNITYDFLANYLGLDISNTDAVRDYLINENPFDEDAYHDLQSYAVDVGRKKISLATFNKDLELFGVKCVRTTTRNSIGYNHEFIIKLL